MSDLDDVYTGDQGSLRQKNLSSVLTHLQRNAPISRAALAEITGLNRATITRLVRELMEHGLVHETGFQILAHGRPSILLQLNPDAGYIMGAEIEIKFSSVILTDLASEILWRGDAYYASTDPQDLIWDKTIQLIQEAYDCAKKADQHILGLAMSLPGLVDVDTGSLLFAPNMQWTDVPIRQWLTRRFDFPVYVDNKANMGALCESIFGSGQDSNFVLYINITAGVGAGIVLNKQLLPGASGLMGEVGHMTINPNGPLCNCGSYGCWETYVSALAVFRRVRDSVLKGEGSLLAEVVKDGIEGLTIPMVVEAANKGDRVALAAFEETGYYLGIGLANLINILNPQKVVLGGYLIQAYDLLLPGIQKVVHERALRWPREAAEIVAATYLNDSSLMGAIATVYSQILSNPGKAIKAKLGAHLHKEVLP